MFTGIVESMGEVQSIELDRGNMDITIISPISHELKVDQSVSHNGICLTVVECNAHSHRVTAIAETIDKSNIGSLVVGMGVNLERCMKLDGRLDGHIVQGHVDDTTTCLDVQSESGSWRFRFHLDEAYRKYLVAKGSICINGVSLTIAALYDDSFEVAIIPFTYEHTNFKQLKKGSIVNLEFDIVGKYILRNLELSA